MTRHPLRLASLFVALGISAISAGPPAARAATPAEVNAAVDKAVAYLKKAQGANMWEPAAAPDAKGLDPKGGPSEACKWGGQTAIATYALLAAGESDQNPEMQKAIKWLSTADIHGTYASGLRSQVWLLTPENKARNLLRDHEKDNLLYSMIGKGSNVGFYGYSYGGPAKVVSLGDKPGEIDKNGPTADWWFDRSNSQYGVLGMWALERAGAEVPQKYWETVDKAWKAAQGANGSWSYGGGGQTAESVTMTEAGLATLYITQDYLLRGKAWEPCNGGVENSNIDNALAYMDKHITQGVAGGNYYAMYGVERIGVASGRKYFGTVDWFKVGADFLVKNQGPDGSWSGNWGAIPDTCFGLLFLVRGRAPVMMNKLEYAFKKNDDNWNERPRDAANLARWMGGRVESSLNWQIVNLKVSMDDLHDAPILYLSGNAPLNFAEADLAKLRLFVEQGGLILGNADCGKEPFAKSFEKLGTTLFPKYEFRALPTNHPIFTNEQYSTKKWRVHPKVTGLTNGVRELMLLIPDADTSRAWQTDSTQTKKELFELAGNIFLYSVDKKNLRYKGDTYIVQPDASAAAQHIKLARIETDGNWNPEPGAWTRLSAIVHNIQHTSLDAEAVKLGSGKLASGGYKIAHLTGTTKTTFSADQRAELKDFVTKGGTLVIDAAGGNAEFADSAEAELKTIFGDAATKGLAAPLTFSSAVFASPTKIESLTFRPFARRVITGNTKTSRLKGIAFGSRIGVFYSREDISSGLVGEEVDGIVGYEPASSVQLMTNIVMYANGAAAPAVAAQPAAAEKSPVQ